MSRHRPPSRIRQKYCRRIRGKASKESLGTGIKCRGRRARLVSSSDEACSQSGSDNDTAAEEQAEFERVQNLLVLKGITRKMDEMIQLLQPIQDKTDTVSTAHKTSSVVENDIV
jgi:hypothetical protein